jgi:hypothetical protein
MTDKTLKDLEGWTQTFSTPSIRSESAGYTVFISPDEKRVAQVEMTTEAVALIFNRETKKIEYIHPLTRRGMERIGVAELVLKQMERILGRAYEKEEAKGE